jgi:hypothetical protein
MMRERDRKDDCKALLRPFPVLVLTAPLQPIPGRQLQPLLHGRFRVPYEAAQIATGDVAHDNDAAVRLLQSLLTKSRPEHETF